MKKEENMGDASASYGPRSPLYSSPQMRLRGAATIAIAGVVLLASMLFVAIAWGATELILAEIPTPIIVTGCAVCLLLEVAVVLAALKVVSLLKP